MKNILRFATLLIVTYALAGNSYAHSHKHHKHHKTSNPANTTYNHNTGGAGNNTSGNNTGSSGSGSDTGAHKH